MFVSSMSSEELCAEAMKDFSILPTKIDLFMDRCGKRYRQEHFIGRFIKRMVVTTKRNNSWTIAFLALNEGFTFLIYAPITGQETCGYIALSSNRNPLVLEYTPHFMQRYRERYLKYYNLDTGNYNALEYFSLKNNNTLYVRQPDNSYYFISEQGVMIGRLVSERMISHKTYIGDDNLSLRKRIILDEEYKNLCAANALLRLPDNLNLETVRNVASRYNLGDEFTQRWYAWHAMEFVQS